MDDRELLGRYAQEQDQQAFAELVGRHGGWVYAAARRQVRDEHAAEDVTQAVFLLLARRAGRLSGYGYLGGWLFRALGYCVKEALRERVRRERREEEAARMRGEMDRPAAGWEQIAPELDAAVGGLGRADREAVLLRFYEQKPLAEMGRVLGVSEEAARKRVERAVGRLREQLAGRGVEMEAGSLGAMVLAHAGAGGPAGLVVRVTGAMGGAGVGNMAGGIAQGAAKMMTLARVKVAACVVGAVVMAGVTMVAVAGPSSGTAGSASAPASVPAPATVAKAASWSEEMKQTYGLADGEVLRRVKSPQSAARTSYWRSVDHREPGDTMPPPDQMVVEWNGELKSLSMGWGTVDPLASVLATVMGWSSGDYEIAPELRAKRVPGDWVIRAGATEQQKLDALVAILRRDADPAITIEKRASEREVVVVRGQFEYQPHVDASGGNQVLLYSDPYVAEEGGGGGAGSLAEFFKTMGNCAGVQVVDEVKGSRPEMVSWHTLSSCWVGIKFKGAEREQRLDSLLRNVAAQTGLSLIREKKQTGVWVVGRKKEGKQ